jgi:hypothetical protein
MSGVTVHAMQFTIRAEPHRVIFDQADEPGILTLRGEYTPGQAEKLAAELLMAAEKARQTRGDAA